jgi:hypothetical protein
VFLNEKKIGYMYAVLVAFVLIVLLVLACVYIPSMAVDAPGNLHKTMLNF